MKTISSFRLASLIVPIVCVVLAIALIIHQWNRLKRLEADSEQTRQQITVLDNEAREITSRPPPRKTAVVPPSPNEQPLFIDTLRSFATAGGVQLAKYENKTVPPPASGTQEAKANLLPPGVIALTSNVEVTGNYNGVRSFMYQLWNAPRLFNTSDLKWTTSEKWPSTRLAFTLTRYVYAVPRPALPTATPQAAPSSTPPHS